MDVKPTFVLRGFKFADVRTEYGAGVYKTYQPRSSSITIKESRPLIEAVISDSVDEGVHSFRDRNNSVFVFATSNHQEYSLVKRENQGDQTKRCQYGPCGR